MSEPAAALAGRSRGIAVALALALAACLALAATTAAEEAVAAPSQLRIVAPRAGALVTSKAVEVEVRAPRRLRILRASVQSGPRRTEASGHFHPARNGERHARLRVGRELREGVNDLYLRVRLPSGRERTVLRTFTVASRHADLIALRRPRLGTEVAPVRAAVRLKGGRLRARLNGRDVRDAFKRQRRSRTWQASLTVHDGLRFGRNRLVVTAFTREGRGKGRYERLRRSFRVRRDRPLADAGRDRRGLTGVPERLDGRRSRPQRRGERLALRWRVIDGPRGAKPRLRGARSARPRLIARQPGRYTIRLTARGRGGGRAGGDRARASAAAPAPAKTEPPNGIDSGPRYTPEPPEENPAEPEAKAEPAPAAGTSTDTVTVTVQPDVLPRGVPIEINPTEQYSEGYVGSVAIGEVLFKNTGGTYSPQLLVLDRETLEPIENGTGYNSQAEFEAAIEAVPPGRLVFLEGGGPDANIEDTPGLHAALATIGAEYPQGQRQSAFESGQWSIVGVSGTEPGTAYQLLGRHQGSNPNGGQMSGFLRLDSQGNFAFTWPPEYITFDTHAPGSTATENVVSVNGTDYHSWNLEPDWSGIQVLYFDADTLQLRESLTYLNEPAHDGRCPGPPPPAQPECLWAFSNYQDGKLNEIIADPDALLIVTTIGKPNAWDAQQSWAALGHRLEAFGANPQVMLPLSVKGQKLGDYSFIGLNGLGELGPNRGPQVLTSLDGVETPRLVGTFRRNRQGLLLPAGAASPGPDFEAQLFQPSLERLLAQPPEPFPAFDTPAERAAQSYIAGELGLPLDPKFGIRVSYWQNLSIDWNSEEGRLGRLPACPTSPCSEGFHEVQEQLLDEFAMVASVLAYFTVDESGSVRGVLTEALLGEGIDFFGISDEIMTEYDKPSGTAHGPNVLGIIEGIMILGEVAGDFTEPPVGPVFGVAVGALVIAQSVTNDSSGNSIWDPIALQERVGSFAKVLKSLIESGLDGLDRVAVLLVSDWGRLQAADKLIDQSGGEGWGLSSQRAAALRRTLTLSLRRYMWSSLLPVPLQVASAPGTVDIFVPPMQQWVADPFGGGAEDGNLNQRVWYLCKHGSEWTFAPKHILDSLFNSPTEQPAGVGFTPQYFYGRSVGSSSPGFENVTVEGENWDEEHNRCHHEE